MNLKNKETQLFETLNKLDSIADLIKNSKEESSYLRKLSSQLEKEKEELNQKSKNLELEKNSIIDELKASVGFKLKDAPGRGTKISTGVSKLLVLKPKA